MFSDFCPFIPIELIRDLLPAGAGKDLGAQAPFPVETADGAVVGIIACYFEIIHLAIHQPIEQQLIDIP